MDSRAYSAEVKPSGYEGRIKSGMTTMRTYSVIPVKTGIQNLQ